MEQVPHIDRFVDNHKNIIEQTFEIINYMYPDCKLVDVDYKVFPGGKTNKLIGWCVEGCAGEYMLIVKVYGINTDLFIDRELEINALRVLNSKNLPPKLIATFDNGYIYSFVHGKPVSLELYYKHNLICLVPDLVTRIHQLQFDTKKKKRTCLWDRSIKFINAIPNEENDTFKEKTKRFLNAFPNGKRYFIENLNNIEKRFEHTKSPIVFCHNDMLLDNILYKDGRVHLIDYEYVEYNYQAFDIANHFVEFAGVDDFNPSNYPTKEYQLEWLKRYVVVYNNDASLTDEEINARVNELFCHVQQFFPVTHFFWTLWAILQSFYSDIDFDYLGYAIIRHNEFQKYYNDMPKLES